MEINIKSSRTVVATDSAVLKIKELAEKEDACLLYTSPSPRDRG